MPALVVFIGVGMVIGSDGLGWIRFGDFELAQEIGVIALALILFEGGLSSGFSTIRPGAGPVAQPGDSGHAAHRADHRCRGDSAARPQPAGGFPARFDDRLDRRCRCVLGAARLDPQAQARRDPGRRGGLQRRGRGDPRYQLHHADREPRRVGLGDRRSLRQGLRHRRSVRMGGGPGRAVDDGEGQLSVGRALPGRLGGDRCDRLRQCPGG